METSKTIYVGDLSTEITHLLSDTKIVTDAPQDNHGKGESFSPSDLFASSLGSCMLTIMGISGRSHGFDITGATLKTTKVMGVNPRRVSEIIVEVTFPKNYSDKEKKFIEACARECPVSNSLHPDIKQTVSFIYPD